MNMNTAIYLSMHRLAMMGITIWNESIPAYADNVDRKQTILDRHQAKVGDLKQWPNIEVSFECGPPVGIQLGCLDLVPTCHSLKDAHYNVVESTGAWRKGKLIKDDSRDDLGQQLLGFSGVGGLRCRGIEPARDSDFLKSRIVLCPEGSKEEKAISYGLAGPWKVEKKPFVLVRVWCL